MNSQIEFYEPFTILKNEDFINIHSSFSKKWHDEIKKYNPLFRFHFDFPQNRTLFYNYDKSDTQILSFDQFLNIYTLQVPVKATTFYENILPPFIQYLTNHHKSLSSPQIINETNCRLYIYIHQNHQQSAILRSHPLIYTHPNSTKKSILNRDLGDYYLQMEIFLHYDEQWNIVPKISATSMMNG